VATASAKSVFPQPGGPNSNRPPTGRIPAFLNNVGCSNGHSTDSINSRFISSSGISLRYSLKADGFISL